MLRACKRVLRSGGKLAFTVIQITPGIPAERHARARDASPGFPETSSPYSEMILDAGFHQVTERDVTTEYRHIATRWLEEAADLEAELRTALGDAVFEQKHADRVASFAAIDEGGLSRALYTAKAD